MRCIEAVAVCGSDGVCLPRHLGASTFNAMVSEPVAQSSVTSLFVVDGLPSGGRWN